MNAIKVESSRNCTSGPQPNVKVSKIGIISRDYRKEYNGNYDFSKNLSKVLSLLDEKGCDAVVFSLLSFYRRRGFSIHRVIKELKNIKLILLETFDFDEDEKYRTIENQAYFFDKKAKHWLKYIYHQKIVSLSSCKTTEVQNFVSNEIPLRVFGNSISLLCGETNGVKYSKDNKRIEDTFKLRTSIPDNVEIILNPIHDRMTRFEMKLKRKFLSRKGRWLISVWNKGKENKNGTVKDGKKPAWDIYHNGEEVTIEPIENDFEYEIGIVQTSC